MLYSMKENETFAAEWIPDEANMFPEVKKTGHFEQHGERVLYTVHSILSYVRCKMGRKA